MEDLSQKIFNLPYYLRVKLRSVDSADALYEFCRNIGISTDSYQDIKRNIESVYVGDISLEDFESYLSLSWPEKHLEILNEVNKYYFDPITDYIEEKDENNFVVPKEIEETKITDEPVEAIEELEGEAEEDAPVIEEREPTSAQTKGADQYREKI